MHKIYTLARKLIDKYLAQMTEKLGLSHEEIAYKTTLVEDERVVFFIHDRLKTLLEKQLHLRKPRFAKISFQEDIKNHWLVTIEAGGAESFFFARQLQRVLYSVCHDRTHKKRYIQNNMEFLKAVLAAAVEKAGKDPKEFLPEMEFERKIYFVSVQINGTKIGFSDASVDLLARTISNQIPGFFRVISEAK